MRNRFISKRKIESDRSRRECALEEPDSGKMKELRHGYADYWPKGNVISAHDGSAYDSEDQCASSNSSLFSNQESKRIMVLTEQSMIMQPLNYINKSKHEGRFNRTCLRC